MALVSKVVSKVRRLRLLISIVGDRILKARVDFLAILDSDRHSPTPKADFAISIGGKTGQ